MTAVPFLATQLLICRMFWQKGGEAASEVESPVVGPDWHLLADLDISKAFVEATLVPVTQPDVQPNDMTVLSEGNCLQTASTVFWLFRMVCGTGSCPASWTADRMASRHPSPAAFQQSRVASC